MNTHVYKYLRNIWYKNQGKFEKPPLLETSIWVESNFLFGFFQISLYNKLNNTIVARNLLYELPK